MIEFQHTGFLNSQAVKYHLAAGFTLRWDNMRSLKLRAVHQQITLSHTVHAAFQVLCSAH